MTIALESEVVSTAFSPKTRLCSYTIARDGKRWTASIPLDALLKHKGPTRKKLCRDHVATALQNAMNGPPDPPKGTINDPHRPATWAEFDKLPHGVHYLNPADGKLHRKD